MNMTKYLKPQYEIFAQELIKTGNATRSYEKAFGPHKTRVSLRTSAANLRKRPIVAKRIKELQMKITRRSDISLEKVLNDYQQALEMAKDLKKPGDMVAAAREQARIVGLLVERQEIGRAGDFEKMENISEIIEAVKNDVGEEAAQKLIDVFDLLPKSEPAKGASVPDSSTEALLTAEPGSDAVN